VGYSQETTVFAFIIRIWNEKKKLDFKIVNAKAIMKMRHFGIVSVDQSKV